MSKRKRHQEKGTEVREIEWLKHRTGYPSPEEREKIIQLRRELEVQVISLAVARAGRDDPRYRELVRKYGSEEVLHALDMFKQGMDTQSRIADEAKSNREYRLRYSRFGAGLPFYTEKERDELFEEYSKSVVARFDDSEHTPRIETSEVEKRLLMDWRKWEDITPLAIPPRPEDFSTPAPASYPAPISEVLEFGNDLEKHYDFAEENELARWRKFIPALTRMALDPGLLNGWPAEAASWAPWHAIHILGNLQAWESAPALAELTDLENDWLSDHLPHIWVDMGIQVEPSLWMILEDQRASTKRRGLAAEALFMMTDDNAAMYHKVVSGFEKLLQNPNTFDPTLNGHMISFLHDMEAIEDIYDTIEDAFENNRVDPEIITPEDLEEDDFFDDDFNEDSDDKFEEAD